jgi:cytochrome c oxidase subunit III
MSAAERPMTLERPIAGTSSPVMGMVLFVAGEAMFFAAFFAAYFSIRASRPVWPPNYITPPEITIPAILTTILVISSFVIQFGVRAARRGNIKQAQVFIAITVLMGLVFLGLQAYDYSQLEFGIKDGIYPSLFYVMTGLHMAHVIGGVLLLVLIGAQSLNRETQWAKHETLQAGAIYWDFVDIVWVLLFIVFYVAVPR